MEVTFTEGEITVLSDAEVSLTIGAADQHFVDLIVSGTTASVSLTVSGLTPSTSYYVFLDDFSNFQEELTTDAEGSLSLSFLLVEAFPELPNLRHVIIQDEWSTLFLRDDATGGDCTFVGTWDALTKTCTLTQTVTQTIQIDANGITLDCANQIIQKGTGSIAVNVSLKNDVTVKNCDIRGPWSFGIAVSFASRVSVVNNVVDGASFKGIDVTVCFNQCEFSNNTILNGLFTGFSIDTPLGIGGTV